MRRTVPVIVLALAAVAVLGSPFQASAGHPVGKIDYTIATATVCAAACPYWTDDADPWGASCFADPITVPGSFHDRVITVPATVGGAAPKLLRWVVTPVIDYDIVVCDKTAGTTVKYKDVAHSANEPTDNCATGAPLIGCVEEVSVNIAPGTPQSLVGHQLVLRSYNWSDGPSAAASYWYINH